MADYTIALIVDEAKKAAREGAGLEGEIVAIDGKDVVQIRMTKKEQNWKRSTRSPLL